MATRRPKAKLRRPDPKAMRLAVRKFLEASGVDLSDPNLKETPERVTEAWLNEFLDGYRKSPKQALGEVYPAEPGPTARELVVVTDLRYRSVCPHHLLPYEGRAHLAYVPGNAVVGFGRLSALLDAYAHRLILQEDLARKVAQALTTHLKSPGAACVLEGEMTCLRLRGEQQEHARTHAEAYEGILSEDGALRTELWARISGARK